MRRRTLLQSVSLSLAAPAAPHGVTLLVEVVNTLAPVEPLHPRENHLDYYLDHAGEAFRIVDEVSSPFVKVLFDLYHVQIMDGNLIATIRRNIGRIGHFHVGDVPGRHQPGTVALCRLRSVVRERLDLPGLDAWSKRNDPQHLPF